MQALEEKQELSNKISDLVAEYKSMPGGLLPLLHALQDNIGFIPESSYALIAKALSLSVAEVHGVVTFYHHYCLGNCALSPAIMLDQDVHGRVSISDLEALILEAGASVAKA